MLVYIPTFGRMRVPDDLNEIAHIREHSTLRGVFSYLGFAAYYDYYQGEYIALPCGKSS